MSFPEILFNLLKEEAAAPYSIYLHLAAQIDRENWLKEEAAAPYSIYLRLAAQVD